MIRHGLLLFLILGPAAPAAAGTSKADLLDLDVDRLSHRSLSKRIAARERVLEAGEKAVPALLKVIRGSKSKDPYKYQACLYLLGEIGSPKATRDLLRVAEHVTSSDRRSYWALASLAKIGASEALPIAKESLRHDDGSTRRAAVHVILSQPPTVSVPQVGKLRIAQSAELAAFNILPDALRRGQVAEVHPHEELSSMCVSRCDEVDDLV